MKDSKRFILTKTFTFDSAHSLKDYEGKCANLHGHTYKLEVSISGERDHRGLVFDFGHFKELVSDKVISYLDHECLNQIVDFNPTAENICMWIWDTLEPLFRDRGYTLERVALWETPTSCCTIEREKGQYEGQ